MQANKISYFGTGNECNCNNLQTFSYINVAGTMNPRGGSGWSLEITRLIGIPL